MNELFPLNKRIQQAAEKAMELCSPVFQRIETVTEYNQQKVLKAFIDNSVSESHFVESTGYGYGDRGRETLDRVVADVFGAQDALVRHSFASGTHTLAVALFGVLRPGDRMLSVTGRPYDTIHDVIGITGEGMGSLKDFGVEYAEVELKEDGTVDLDAVRDELQRAPVKMAYIQRSRGYSLRPSLSVEDIRRIAGVIHEASPDTVVMVDNCYGEFVEELEPTQAGADLMAGSLIKNPGGGIAKTGGYIAGRHALVEQCAYRHTTPGTGREIGATLGQNRELFMGFFNAPHIVGEALKTACFSAALFHLFGYNVTPAYHETRHDIIQCVMLEKPDALVAFCQGMQSGAPVDSFVTPEPWDMPGYDSKVIMAAGAFTLGSSIELSADAPMREPYVAWMQGAFHFHSAKMGVLLAAQQMLEKGLLKGGTADA